MLKKLLLFAILSPLALQPVMKANVITETITKVFTPWDPNLKKFNKGLEFGLGVVALCNKFYDSFYAPNFKTPEDYTKALRDPALRGTLAVYNFVWGLKKVLAINEFYRVGTTFRKPKESNAIEYSLSIMRMLGIFGSSLLEKDHLKTVCKKTGLPIW